MQDGLRQRAELQKAIWAIANEVRGAVEGWDFRRDLTRQKDLV